MAGGGGGGGGGGRPPVVCLGGGGAIGSKDRSEEDGLSLAGDGGIAGASRPDTMCGKH